MGNNNIKFAFCAGMFIAVILISVISLYIPYSFNKSTCKAIYEKNDNLIIKQCQKYYETKEV